MEPPSQEVQFGCILALTSSVLSADSDREGERTSLRISPQCEFNEGGRLSEGPDRVEFNDFLEFGR